MFNAGELESPQRTNCGSTAARNLVCGPDRPALLGRQPVQAPKCRPTPAGVGRFVM